jgi:hypothetical protein
MKILDDEALNALPTHRLLALLKAARAKASALQNRTCRCRKCNDERRWGGLPEAEKATLPYVQQVARIKTILMGRPHSEKAHKKRDGCGSGEARDHGQGCECI